MTGPVPSESTTSSSSSIELAMEGACGGAGLGAPARAISADPATKSGWLVLMYAAWIEIKLDTYSDVGPSRSRSSSETTSISWACSRGNRCSSCRSVQHLRSPRRLPSPIDSAPSHDHCLVRGAYHHPLRRQALSVSPTTRLTTNFGRT